MEKPWQSLKPELNPLTNPILGRNLERWARVYFNTPPEKRDQAVTGLLHELENEASGDAASEPGRNPAFSDADFHEVVCPACGRRNQPYQRFCGICGSPFPGGDSVAEKAAVANAASGQEADLEWLRQRAFSSLDQPERARNTWRYSIAITAMVLAGLLYLQWGSRPLATPAPQPAPAASLPESTPEPAQPGAESAGSNLSAIESKPVEKSKETLLRKPGLIAGPAPAPSPQTTSSQSAGAESGTQELLLAQNYLQERSDTTGAVKLLWKAVGKQNTSATLLLADLYARGEGVPKNCDQARLLLVAAARKGVSAAAQKLRSLESSGCQ